MRPTLRLGDHRRHRLYLRHGGLTIGGADRRPSRGIGTLPCDNLLSAEVVTADGKILTVSERANEDLFWALRGGGGNFGVVTSIEYQLHPAGRSTAARCFTRWVTPPVC